MPCAFPMVWKIQFKRVGNIKIPWAGSQIRTNARQLLLDITSLVLTLVRTEVAAATPDLVGHREEATRNWQPSVMSSAQCLSSMPTIKHTNRICCDVIVGRRLLCSACHQFPTTKRVNTRPAMCALCRRCQRTECDLVGQWNGDALCNALCNAHKGMWSGKSNAIPHSKGGDHRGLAIRKGNLSKDAPPAATTPLEPF